MTEPPVVALIDTEAARFAKALADLPVILRPYVAPTPPAERALATIAYALAAPDRENRPKKVQGWIGVVDYKKIKDQSFYGVLCRNIGQCWLDKCRRSGCN